MRLECPLSANKRHRGTLFDHLVGTRKERLRYVEAERLGGLEIDHQLKLSWRLYRKVAYLFAL